jgi:hypothetical protein
MAATMTKRMLYGFVIAGLAAACSDERVYVNDGELYQVALTAATAPAIQTKEGTLYIVETHAELPIKVPSNGELATLKSGAAAYKKLPFPRLPWVVRDDIALQLDFSLSNLDKTSHDVTVIVNGADEFFEYEPSVRVVDEQLQPSFSQWERSYTVAANSRMTATVREEDLDEVAVDLATVVNGAPSSDEVVYFENKSDSDPRSMKYIPPVIPGLTALRLGLRATEAAPILLEATLRARDVGDKLASDTEPHMRLMPQPFATVVPPN